MPLTTRAATLTAGAALVLALSGCADGDDQPGAEPTVVEESTSSGPDALTSERAATLSASPTPLSPDEQAALDRRLIDAAWDNDVTRARRLVAQGADVDAKDETEQNAYLIATSEGYDVLLELTLRNGADVRALDRFDGTGVIRAAERGHWTIVGRLVQERVPVDHVNNLGWTALHEAIVLGDGTRDYVDTVRVLVAAGADVSVRALRDGTAPLEQARSRGFEAIATLLARTLRSDDGEAAQERAAGRHLALAARSGSADAAALALRSGAEVDAPDGRGRTPADVAASRGHADVVRLLVALGSVRP